MLTMIVGVIGWAAGTLCGVIGSYMYLAYSMWKEGPP